MLVTDLLCTENTRCCNNIHMVYTGKQTICDCNHLCREVCMSIVLEESHDLIGGPGKTVEID